MKGVEVIVISVEPDITVICIHRFSVYLQTLKTLFILLLNDTLLLFIITQYIAIDYCGWRENMLEVLPKEENFSHFR